MFADFNVSNSIYRQYAILFMLGNKQNQIVKTSNIKTHFF